LEYTIRRLKENKKELKLKGTYKLLAHAYNIHIMGENIHTIRKNTESPLNTNKDVGLEMTPEKTKHMLILHYQKAEQKYSIKIANTFFEDMAKLKYLGRTLTDQNCMQEKINSKLNSRNACYHSVKSLSIFLPAV
jgi:hypothetical protein